MSDKPGNYHSIVRTDIIRHIPHGTANILDVGCGSGASIKFMKEQGYSRVCGIEMEPAQVEMARQHADKVLHLDLNLVIFRDPAYLRQEFPEPFDTILFGDILEHLPYPNLVLLRMRDILDTDGHIVCSIPNAGYLGMVDKILNQSFQYQDAGHFDATHIRFFCGSDIRKLVEGCGFEIVKLEPLKLEDDQPDWFEGMNYEWNNWQINNITKEHYTQLMTYQWLCVAKKTSLPGATPSRNLAS